MLGIKNVKFFTLFVILIVAFVLLPLYMAAGSKGTPVVEKEMEEMEEVVEKEMGPPPDVIKIGAGLQLSGWAVGDTELAHTQPYEMWIEQLNEQGTPRATSGKPSECMRNSYWKMKLTFCFPRGPQHTTLRLFQS
jgi:hypothetical protein